MNCEPLSGGPPAARVRYSKVAGGCLHFVIVDLLPDGREEFWSQETGEVRWFAFDPAPAEREAALSLCRSGGRAGEGWPLLWP